MKRIVFHLAHPVDHGRIDVVETKPGCVLVDSQSVAKYTPLINVGQVVAVQLVDDEAEGFDRTPSVRRANHQTKGEHDVRNGN